MKLIQKTVMFMGIETIVTSKESKYQMDHTNTNIKPDIVVPVLDVTICQYDYARCDGHHYESVSVNGLVIPRPSAELVKKVIECHHGQHVMEINFK